MKQAIKHLYKQDDIFKKIVETYGIPIKPSRPPGFETLILLILEQQVSIDSAKATFIKLKTTLKKIEPKILIKIEDEQFRSLGVSRQKTSYIKALSAAVINKELIIDTLPLLAPDEVRKTLIKIKGIGNWTIDVYLMFCLQSADIIPLGDIAVVNTIKELFNIHDKEAMEVYTNRWSPYRSAATFLLWHYYLGKRNRKVVY